METKTMLIIGGVLLGVLVIVLGTYGFVKDTYNTIQELDVNCELKNGYVESAYQRRADLIPNLVATVQGSASFEKSTLVELSAMRSQAGMLQQKMRDANSVDEMQAINDDKTLDANGNPNGVAGVLARLMVVVEAYPSIRSTDAFNTLMSEIEGTENRINYERNLYNENVGTYKTYVRKFPGLVVANYFGYTENKWQMYKSKEGSDVAPVVTFKF